MASGWPGKGHGALLKKPPSRATMTYPRSLLLMVGRLVDCVREVLCLA